MPILVESLGSVSLRLKQHIPFNWKYKQAIQERLICMNCECWWTWNFHDQLLTALAKYLPHLIRCARYLQPRLPWGNIAANCIIAMNEWILVTAIVSEESVSVTSSKESKNFPLHSVKGGITGNMSTTLRSFLLHTSLQISSFLMHFRD